MSSSISANPALNTPVLALAPNTRRRSNVSVSEKQRTTTNNFEMAFDEQMSSDGNKIRSDADLLQANKHSIASTAIPPRPRRKAVKTGSEKTQFQKVASVLLKNVVLVVVLLGFVQLISRLLSSGYKDVALVTEGGVVSEIEERIGEIDSLVKKTAKMVQVQFEVVDKKIENEVGGMRRDLMKNFDEKSAVLVKGLKDLEGRMDGLDKSLSEFESYKFLTKADLESFSEELKNSRGGEGTDEALSLDEISAIARDIVVKEIEKHAADGIGRVDYALASGGASVVEHSEPLVRTGGNWMKSRKINDNAHKMLRPSFGEPGHCFALKGSNGFVDVRLRTGIIPDAITLEHVAKSVAFDRSSAPKDCQISGWLQGGDADQSSQANKFLLAEFTYDLERSKAQTYNVDSTNVGLVNTVRFEFTSNYGAPHTCIYRLRVHGHEPASVAVSTLQY